MAAGFSTAVGLKHNPTLIGRLETGAGVVTPG